jgi:hypothetical protein
MGGRGWLVTRSVCNRCNHTLGKDVDRVADAPVLVALRMEAGLEVWRGLPVEYFDEEVDITFDGWLKGDGTIELTRDRYGGSEGSFYISGPTLALAQARANRIAERMRSRGRTVTLSEPFQRETRLVPIWLRGGPQDAKGFNQLLVREAAKAAVEYVALAFSSEMALRTELDPIRTCARDGIPLDGAWVGTAGREIWLPRLGLMMNTGEDAPTPEELTRLKPGTQSPEGRYIPRLRHELMVARRAEGCQFTLVLFGGFGVRVPLPSALPWPGVRYHFKDFERLRTGDGRSLT